MLRKGRLFFLLVLFCVYRLYAHRNVPWINCDRLEQMFSEYGRHTPATILGADLSRCSLLMLGLSPFLSAILFLALASLFFPGLERLRKGGEKDTLKLTRWTVTLSIVLAAFESITLMWAMGRNDLLVDNAGTGGIYIAALTIIAGYSVILLLVSELGRVGLGSGIGLIVLASTLTRLPRVIGDIYERSRVEGPEGMSPLWFMFQFIVAPAILLVAIAAICVALNGLFKRDGTAIACIAVAGCLIASGGIPGLPLPNSQEPYIIRLTREALSDQQPMHYVFLFITIVALWVLLQSGVFRKKTDRLRSNALELIAGIHSRRWSRVRTFFSWV
jgi:SecY translocase